MKMKNIPGIGPLGSSVARTIREMGRKWRGKQGRPVYTFSRLNKEQASANDRDILPVLNLMNYTKTSGSTYNGQDFPAGYHTLELKGFHLPGQRHPRERLGLVPFDFTGKTVLDIGCNQGGMLFAVAEKARHCVGIDYDYRVVNAANRVRSHVKADNTDFYVFNLEREDLNLIRDFVPGEKVDIAFLLSVCMWISNWKDVITLAHSISSNMLFETNGSAEQQDEQLAYLSGLYKNVQLLSGTSMDDSSQKSRRLYLCN